ncbi:Cof-type HAD-IIB family hydrolase [Pediococcus ethanolidurans]|uniref:Cof-type HAD-IIB family hydrolase n=1 Tax=Pediococcus ethanolidurans TaxID=319653 RepID=UPI001C1EBBB6|nr:Cof-type HAD-IIB family hydrolase [Pediococcus ethanolidurans]MBU7555556.1 HAD family phosphatase [Pediococcus ethanolidurans]MBU7562769.1 HAD family phosphatase [Pediococcus ethanolidurans]MCT4399098.1 HAD family phosphatase [Pediococcus ethanolidurans]MCV3315334.1 Cof-type HAD-IIB family hydrolase [Pediococcus ethanolidurans]MCV3321426.1 Cof-type HAD-IIB family hydrolase [Pediococcus ethanolidurans]
MISIIASDMDGTLLNEKMEVSSENAAAIKQAQSEGVHFIVATGRQRSEAKPLIEQFGIQAPMITLNGAAVYDVDGKALDMVPLHRAAVTQIMRELNLADLYYEVVTGDGVVSNSRTMHIQNLAQLLNNLNPDTPFKLAVSLASARVELMDISYVDSYQELIDDHNVRILKIIAFSNDGPKKLKPVSEKINQKVEVAITSSSRTNIEINNIRAQKGIALQHYADELNIPMSQVMSIGDNLNDASMLKIADTSYAMGNAIPEIKQLANHLTVSNNENGVGKAILEQLKTNRQ